MSSVFHPNNDETINPSGNESIRDVMTAFTGRRNFMKGTLGAATLATLGGFGTSANAYPVAPAPTGAIGFTGLPPNLAAGYIDAVRVPAGYTAKTLVGWGDAIGVAGPNALVGHDHSDPLPITAAVQNATFGQHNDGMHFFPFPAVGAAGVSNDRGLLVVNHEYVDPGLHANTASYGAAAFIVTKALVDAQVAAHGVSVVELRRMGGKWNVVKPSAFARRITGATPMTISGPAAGDDAMKTAADPTGKAVLGTLNNCAHGITPWGTYLTCEENWNGNFGGTGAVDTSVATELGKLNRRYGVTAGGFGYRWHTTDPRWDVSTNPNEPNLFGWVVEIDPYDPKSIPVKRTALGRFKHESAQYVVDKDDRLALYMGDDERNEYIYKFVAKGKFNKERRAANRKLLDEGTLYVARFNADLTGQWLPLTPGSIGLDGKALRDNPNFAGADDAEVLAKILIKTRMAGDALGATMMDRPEWTGARPRIHGFKDVEVYCTLTNNNRRGTNTPSVNLADGSTAAGSARPPVDAANPREDNVHGHIIRWREAGRSAAATSFTWDLFVQAGDTLTAKPAKPTNNYKGNIVDSPDGSADYGAPDGLWFDPFGRLWVQTDQVGDGSGDFVNIGSNVMVCADPNTGVSRRFLTSPNRCEVTGVTMTPDGRTMFVGVQHPGEDSTAANPIQFSNWPQGQFAVESDGVTALPPGRPRSSVVVITKDDGGIIGS